MISFAWSFSSVDDARRVGHRILEALAAERSLEDNINACSFLARCDRIYERLAVYIRDNKYSGHFEAILEQLQHVEQPWTKVAGLVTAYKQCLDDVTTSPESETVQRQSRLALEDLCKGVNQVRSDVSNSLETIAGLMHADTQETREVVHMKSQSLYLAFEKLCISEHQEGNSKTLDLQPNDEKHDDMHRTRPPNEESPDSASTMSTANSISIRTFEIPAIAGLDMYTTAFDHLSVEEAYQFDCNELAASSNAWHCGFCDTHNSVSDAPHICTVCEEARHDYIFKDHSEPFQIWWCDACNAGNPFWWTMCPLCGVARSKEQAGIQSKFDYDLTLKKARLRYGQRWRCEDCAEVNLAGYGKETCCFACGTYR
ncbi:hypothetical protein BKA63DRAFT_548600 [Paraphoma chrysanthemicola]|nr:hypothetical protein BKA63DRAFT_548600 [Paraphoma chrysanthemicola]